MRHAGIYALVDPLTDQVRYIGQSTNLESRRKQYENIHKGNFDGASMRLCQWIWDLKKTGHKFEFRIVESRPFDVGWTVATRAWLDTTERKLISEMREHLLNKMPGGSRRGFYAAC